MQISIHRGSKEIGGSCVEVVSECGKRLILDLGVKPGSEIEDKKYQRDIPGLDGHDDFLLALLVTHPHLNQFELLGHIPDNIPVIMGVCSRKVFLKAAPLRRGEWSVPAFGLDFKAGKTFEIGPFKITPYLFDHTETDAYSLLIEADGKRLFYNGDLRSYSRRTRLKRFSEPLEPVRIVPGHNFIPVKYHELFGCIDSRDEMEHWKE